MPSCTGLTAVWCPVCGDCTCDRLQGAEPCLDSEYCPLHSAHSPHADTITMEDCRKQVTAMAEDQGVNLTPHDNETVARFIQYLATKQREKNRHNV